MGDKPAGSLRMLRRWWVPAVLLGWLGVSTAWAVGVYVMPTVRRVIEARAVAGRVGFVPRRIVRDDGSAMRWLDFVPRVPPPGGAARYPAILFLHGHGENGDDGVLQLSNTFGRTIWETQEDFPFYVIAPQIDVEQSWSGDAAAVAIEALDVALAQRPIDPDQVTLAGVSSGGSGVLEVLTRWPRRFRKAVVVSATGGRREPFVEAARANGVGVHLAFNRDDKPSVPEAQRSLAEQLRVAGVEVTEVEYPRRGHDAWNYCFRDPELYRWLLGGADAGGNDYRAIAPPAGTPSEWWFGATGDRLWRVGVDQQGRARGLGYERFDERSGQPGAGRKYDFNVHLAFRFTRPQRSSSDWAPWSLAEDSFFQSPRSAAGDDWCRLSSGSLDSRRVISRLHAAAALLAIGPAADAALGIDRSRWRACRIDGDEGFCDGDEALRCVFEPPDNELWSRGEPWPRGGQWPRGRFYWLDGRQRVRRVWGHRGRIDDANEPAGKSAPPVFNGDCLIELSHQSDALTGWRVSLREGAAAPVRWYSRATVQE